MHYNKEFLQKLRAEAQPFDAKVKFATTNPGFLSSSTDRVSFFNQKIHDEKVAADANWTVEQTVAMLKKAWHDKHFKEDWITSATFLENNVLSGSVMVSRVDGKPLEDYRNVGYMCVEVEGVSKYYFVKTMSFLPDGEVEYAIYLDTITTYLDELNFGGQVKIDRKHYDRWKEVTTDYPEIDVTEPIAPHFSEITPVFPRTVYMSLPKLLETGRKISEMNHITFTTTDKDNVAFDNAFGEQDIMANELALSKGLFDNGLPYKEFNFGSTAKITSVRFDVEDDYSRIKVVINGNGGTNVAWVLKRMIAHSLAPHHQTKKVLPNFYSTSGVWNSDSSMSLQSIIYNKTLKSSKLFKLAHWIRPNTYNEYVEKFNVGTTNNPKFLYMLLKVKADNWGYSRKARDYVTDGGSIVSRLVPLHNNDGTFTLGTGISAKTFGSESYIGNIAVINQANTNGIIEVNEPLEVDWETFQAESSNGPVWTKKDGQHFLNTIQAYHESYTKLVIDNPLYSSLDLTTAKLDDKFKFENEIKLKTSEFLRLNLFTNSGEQKQLFNLMMNPNEPKLIIDRGTIVTETKTNSVYNLDGIYDGKLKDNQAIMITDSFDQVPSLSDPYNQYMLTHQSQYEAGLKSISENRTLGLIGDGVKTVTGSGVGAGLGMVSGVGGSIFGIATGLARGAMGFANTIIGANQKERQYKAQITDLKRQGGDPIGSTSSMFRNNIVQSKLDINNALSLNVYKPTDQQVKTIAQHFNKYGYISNEILEFNSYADLVSRYRFSYWETSNFQKAIDKSKLSNEIVEDINSMFDGGITLWNIIDEQGTVEINNYSKENWENEIAKKLK